MTLWKMKDKIIHTYLFILAANFVKTGLTVSENEDKDKSDSSGYCEKDGCESIAKPTCRFFSMSEFGPDNATIVYGRAAGRLGNQLLNYAALLQLKRQLGMDTYIDAACRDYMNFTFTPESMELPVLSETFCNPDDIPFEPYSLHIKHILSEEEYKKGKLFNFFPPRLFEGVRKGGYKPEDHISNEQQVFQTAYTSYLRKKLKFRPHINTRVRKTLKKIAKKVKKKVKDVTYVGIHNRRTDHLQFMKDTANLKPITMDYFEDAMEYFREEYENVVFVYVSDDMEWGRKNLKNDLNDIFFEGAGEHLDLFMKDIVDPEAATFDLALLASCNHTIITRGTFSMWAGALAGGEYYTEYGTIVPPELMHPNDYLKD